MIKEKLEELKRLVGAEAAEEIVSSVQAKEAELEAAGVRSKEVTEKAEDVPAPEAEGEKTTYTAEEVEAILTEFANEIAEQLNSAAGEEEGGEEEGDEDEPTAKEYLGALNNLSEGLYLVAQAVKEIRDQQNSLGAKIGVLYDEIPSKVKETLRASQDSATITEKGGHSEPADDPLNNFINGFVVQQGR